MITLKQALAVILLFMILLPLCADEGMWIPLLLEQTRYQQMKKMGMTLMPEDIYSINQSSLKDAIVLFGGGCTGVIVSSQGMLFTNHHCGYGQIQKHSSLEHDYLTDGFWAKSIEEELPNLGLSVAFLDRMEDVTSQVLQNITTTMSEQQRNDSIQHSIIRIQKANTPEGSYRVDIKPLYKGTQYFMYVYEVYTDVRLVGAPPSSIGKFGGDTDNWVWPRHTGDFSIFRIYAGKDNKPADYSSDNVPYKPRQYVPVSISGVQQGDFTMVYGYPAFTDEYISSSELDYLVHRNYPTRVALRTIRLEIMDKYMQVDPATRIQYAAKYASVSNAWKKWQGVVHGVQRANSMEQKFIFENKFTEQIKSDSQWKNDYGNLLNQIRQNTKASVELNQISAYYPETITAIELVKFAGQYDAIVSDFSNDSESFNNDVMAGFLRSAVSFYKDYSPIIDRDIFVAMMKAYHDSVPPRYYMDEMTRQLARYKGSFEKWADNVYSKSVFRSYETLHDVLTHHSKKNTKLLANDPVLAIYRSGRSMMDTKVQMSHARLLQQHDSLSRKYMEAQLVVGKNKIFYPDANHTLRVAFGRVEGYSPSDAIEYLPYTTLEGIMEKDNPDIYDYKVPQLLKSIYDKKDFGRYVSGNTVPVCFIASNHTSGGNSGSPVFNGKGELIGLNFDRNWEGTMSDLVYDPDQCRNIVVDTRYILFIIEKIYNANNIIDEIVIH